MTSSASPLRFHSLGMLASSVAGRELRVVGLSNPSALAYSDGTSIFISSHDSDETQRWAVLCQAVILRLGTLQDPSLRKLVGKSRLQKRFLLLELARGSHEFADRLPNAFLNAVAPYVGNSCPESAAHSLKIASGLRPLASIPSWFGTLRPLRRLLSSQSPLGKPLENDELSELEQQLAAVSKEADSEEPDDKYKDNFWQYLSSPLGKDGLFSKAFRDLLDMSSSPEPNGQEGFANTSTERVGAKQVRFLQNAFRAIRSSKALDLNDDLADDHFGRFPEWDGKHARYKENWVTVEEVDAYASEPLLADLTLHEHQLLAFMRALIGIKYSMVKGKRELLGDDFNLDALIQYELDVRVGQADEPNIYQAVRRNGRELEVQIVMDVSSSTLERTANDDSIASLHANLAWLLSEALTRLGCSVALHGFHSWGRKLLKMQRVKAFGDNSSTQIQRRIKQLSIAGYTRMGAAVRFATEALERRKSPARKLLLLISDGFPYDDHYEGRYALQDTRKALEEARAKGLACLCLCVGSDVEASRLAEVYGESNFLSVDRLDKIPPRLGRFIMNALSM